MSFSFIIISKQSKRILHNPLPSNDKKKLEHLISKHIILCHTQTISLPEKCNHVLKSVTHLIYITRWIGIYAMLNVIGMLKKLNWIFPNKHLENEEWIIHFYVFCERNKIGKGQRDFYCPTFLILGRSCWNWKILRVDTISWVLD